jgi:hypothetical protein
MKGGIMSKDSPDLEPKREQGVNWLLVGIVTAVFAAMFGVIYLNTAPQGKRQQDKATQPLEHEDPPEEIQMQEQQRRRQEYRKRQQEVMNESERQREKAVAEEEAWRLDRMENRRQVEFQRSLDGGKTLPGYH